MSAGAQDEKTKKLLMRIEAMRDERRRFEPLWDKVCALVSPVLFSFDGEKRGEPFEIPTRITNKASIYLNTCVSGICGYAVSPNIKWFKLGLTDGFTEKQTGVRQWLESCERILLRTFERCGFYTKTPLLVEYAATVGQSALLIEELFNQDSPVRFTVPEIHELYLNQDESGETTETARLYYAPLESLAAHYGAGALHENARRRLESLAEGAQAGAERDIKIAHFVTKRRNGGPDSRETRLRKKWAGYVIDLDNRHVICETGYDENPYCLFYWEKRGKAYGISPAIKAVNDICLLQQTEKTRLTVAEHSANPSKYVPEKMKGKENFNPGGYNYIRQGDLPPGQIDVGSNYPITLQITDSMAGNVKEWFAVDTFTALRQMDGLQNATATAVAAMQGEQTALLTPMVTNLYQCLSPAIQRTFNILAKKEMLPPLPFAIQRLGGSVRLDFLGVLAQAQKAAYEFGGIMDVLGIASQFAQFGRDIPEFGKAVYWLRPEEVFKKAIESRSAPADIMRTEEEYAQVAGASDAAADAALRQARQSQLQQAVLQNSGKLNQPLVPDSPLAKMTSALGGGDGRA